MWEYWVVPSATDITSIPIGMAKTYIRKNAFYGCDMMVVVWKNGCYVMCSIHTNSVVLLHDTFLAITLLSKQPYYHCSVVN